MDEASFRGISFPCVGMRFGFSQQHAAHMYPDKDAGYIESTGRNNATYSFTACFRNGITGRKISLYPGTYREMMVAMADRTAGPLVHPELGTVQVKPVQQDTVWDPMRRDGVDVELSFIEADDEDLATLLGNLSPLGNCLAAARDLDGAIADVSPVPTIPEKLSPSLLDSIKQLSGMMAEARLSVGNVIGQIDGYASAVDQLAEQLSALDNPKNYPAMEACERLYASLVSLGEEVAKRSPLAVPAIVPRTMSVLGAAQLFGMAIGAFLRLNPSLASGTTVSENTPVLVTL